MKIGKNIKQCRESRNFTQQYMAEKLGISQKTYSRIESDETSVTIELLANIADTLNLKITDIILMDTSMVFHNIANNQTGGEYIAYNATEVKLVIDLYEKLLNAKQEQIDLLKLQIK